jgi:hypothetical protein
VRVVPRRGLQKGAWRRRGHPRRGCPEVSPGTTSQHHPPAQHLKPVAIDHRAPDLAGGRTNQGGRGFIFSFGTRAGGADPVPRPTTSVSSLPARPRTTAGMNHGRRPAAGLTSFTPAQGRRPCFHSPHRGDRRPGEPSEQQPQSWRSPHSVPPPIEREGRGLRSLLPPSPAPRA